MPELKLTTSEAEVLRLVLATLVLNERTGEVGLQHGANRFVSSQQILRLPQRETLDAVSRKLGLPGVRRFAG